MTVQFIEQSGKPAFAVVPIDEWQNLQESLEDLQDIAAAEAARGEESFPQAFVRRLAAGEEHPLKLWREHRGRTLQQLAEQADVTKQMLSQIENRNSRPSADLLAKLAAALDCDMDDLYEPAP